MNKKLKDIKSTMYEWSEEDVKWLIQYAEYLEGIIKLMRTWVTVAEDRKSFGIRFPANVINVLEQIDKDLEHEVPGL